MKKVELVAHISDARAVSVGMRNSGYISFPLEDVLARIQTIQPSLVPPLRAWVARVFDSDQNQFPCTPRSTGTSEWRRLHICAQTLDEFVSSPDEEGMADALVRIFGAHNEAASEALRAILGGSGLFSIIRNSAYTSSFARSAAHEFLAEEFPSLLPSKAEIDKALLDAEKAETLKNASAFISDASRVLRSASESEGMVTSSSLKALDEPYMWIREGHVRPHIPYGLKKDVGRLFSEEEKADFFNQVQTLEIACAVLTKMNMDIDALKKREAEEAAELLAMKKHEEEEERLLAEREVALSRFEELRKESSLLVKMIDEQIYFRQMREDGNFCPEGARETYCKYGLNYTEIVDGTRLASCFVDKFIMPTANSMLGTYGKDARRDGGVGEYSMADHGPYCIPPDREKSFHVCICDSFETRFATMIEALARVGCECGIGKTLKMVKLSTTGRHTGLWATRFYIRDMSSGYERCAFVVWPNVE